jgi:CHAD domain-containing protein
VQGVARHEVRKTAKKVRYGAEFFRSLARKRDRAAAADFIEALKPLQESMGELNDVGVAQEALRRLSDDELGDVGYAAGAVAEELSRNVEGLLKDAVKAAKGFAKAEVFL